jgi:SMODS domain-containing protein
MLFVWTAGAGSEEKMTWCVAQVKAFNDKIKLDAGRLDRIRSAVARFQEYCQNDNELDTAILGNVFLQGSVATGTVIKPTGSDEFDADVVYSFLFDAFPTGTTPVQILDWFRGWLQQSEFYRGNMIPKERCVRINYAGDFHLDIIPATPSIPSHQPYAVPAKDLASWVVSDPVDFANWVAMIDHRSEGVDADGVGRFVRCARMVKRWRDSFFDAASAPTSILLGSGPINGIPTAALA